MAVILKYEIKLRFGRDNLDILLGYFEPQEWLRREVGIEDRDWTWSMVEWDDEGVGFDCIQFKREEDKVKFILRWL